MRCIQTMILSLFCLLSLAQNKAAKAGDHVELKATGKDPDGDKLRYRWWQYEEVDTYPGKVQLNGADSNQAFFTVPADANPGASIHIVLEVNDTGTPTLTRYQRVVVTVI